MLVLNNREIASLFWLAAFIAGSLLYAPVRLAFFRVVRAFFNKPILISLSVMSVYVALCVTLLAEFGIWQQDNLKTTFIWTATFALAAMLQINRISEDRTYFRKSVREIVSFSVLIIFLTEIYTFSLSVEMIMVPIATALILMHAMAETRKEWQQVERLLFRFLTLIGLGLLIYAICRIRNEWGEFATFATGREFIIPIFLSFLFLPYIFLFSVYATYEKVFIRLSFRIEDRVLLRYSKLKAILHFRWDIEFLRRWIRDIQLHDVSTRQDIMESIRGIKALKRREKNPPSVPASQGWSPYAAIAFLQKEGLRTSDYHRMYDRWRASSKPLKISDDILSDDIAFYIEGNESVATQLSLVLEVYNPKNTDEADGKFSEIANILVGKTTDIIQKPAFFLQRQSEVVKGNKRIRIHRDDWQSAVASGYSRNLEIEHNSNIETRRSA